MRYTIERNGMFISVVAESREQAEQKAKENDSFIAFFGPIAKSIHKTANRQ